MQFSERTKWVLADSIRDLMRTMPLDKISVKAITENCQTSRQTFYRNFRDKYDLVNWYFDQIVQKTIRQMGISLTLREGLKKKFDYMLEDKAFFMSVFTSQDYNNLLDYDYRCILNFYQDVAASNGPVTEEIRFLLAFYCHGSMDMTAAWVHGGMTLAPDAMADRLTEAMPEKLRPSLDNLSNYQQQSER